MWRNALSCLLLAHTIMAQTCSFTAPPCAPPISSGNRIGVLQNAEVQGNELVQTWRVKSEWTTQTIEHGGAAIAALCDWDLNDDCANQRAWDSIASQGACLDTLEHRFDLAQTAVDCDYTITDQGNEVDYDKSLLWSGDGVKPNGKTITRTRTRAVSVSFPKGIVVNTNNPTFGGDNVEAYFDVLSIDAINDATPVFTLSLTVITQNPWKVLSVAVTAFPTDVTPITGFIITDDSCNIAGQPCTQTITRTAQFTTPCPTRSMFAADDFGFTLTFECQPQETCTGNNNGILGDVDLAFTVTSEDYCSETSIQTILVVAQAYENTNILSNDAYPNNGGSLSTSFGYNEVINWELEATSDFSLAFRDAEVQTIEHEGTLIYDIAQPALQTTYSVTIRSDGFTGSDSRIRVSYPLTDPLYNTNTNPVFEGEVATTADLPTVSATIEFVVNTEVLLNSAFSRNKLMGGRRAKAAGIKPPGPGYTSRIAKVVTPADINLDHMKRMVRAMQGEESVMPVENMHTSSSVIVQTVRAVDDQDVKNLVVAVAVLNIALGVLSAFCFISGTLSGMIKLPL